MRRSAASAEVQASIASLRADGVFDDVANTAGWREFADRSARKTSN